MLFCKLDVVNIEEDAPTMEEEPIFDNNRTAVDVSTVEENGSPKEPVLKKNGPEEDVNKSSRTLIKKEKKKGEYKEKGNIN